MKSITMFLRRKGYALGEIERLLQQLEPTQGHVATVSGQGGAMGEILDYIQQQTELAPLSRSRHSLDESGITPSTEYGHTLRTPLSSRPGIGFLCVTRVALNRWAISVENQAITPNPSGLHSPETFAN